MNKTVQAEDEKVLTVSTFCTFMFLKNYSHGISIIWGPVILKLPVLI